MSELYQQAVLDHAKRPRNSGPLPGATGAAQADNPLCGDELVVRVRTASGRVEQVAFEGAGCAICIASASMMTLAVQGLLVAEVPALSERVRALLRGEGEPAGLGELAALAPVAQYPARIKCASLAWGALEAALRCAVVPGSAPP